MFRFLIVEDDPDLLKLITVMLREEFASADIISAETSEEAQLLLYASIDAREAFDAAIIDCSVPADKDSVASVAYTVGEAFRDSSPETVLVHITAFVDVVDLRNELIKRKLRIHHARLFLQKG